jgi:hypothetical protein
METLAARRRHQTAPLGKMSQSKMDAQTTEAELFPQVGACRWS